MRLLTILIFLTFFSHNIADSNSLHQIPKKPKQSLNETPKSILIIGDSQSAITTLNGQRITWTWPNILLQKLKPCGVEIEVIALGGKTSKWMLQNGRKKLLQNKCFDRVIIYGGGNDASNMSIPLDTTISNFQKLIDLANSKGSDVWVNLGWKVEGKFMDINILPVGRPANLLTKRSDWKPYIQKRKDLQRLLKEKLTSCQFIGPYDLMSMTSDGIHPTAAGHRLVADYILQTIDTVGCK